MGSGVLRRSSTRNRRSCWGRVGVGFEVPIVVLVIVVVLICSKVTISGGRAGSDGGLDDGCLRLRWRWRLRFGWNPVRRWFGNLGRNPGFRPLRWEECSSSSSSSSSRLGLLWSSKDLVVILSKGIRTIIVRGSTIVGHSGGWSRSSRRRRLVQHLVRTSRGIVVVPV